MWLTLRVQSKIKEIVSDPHGSFAQNTVCGSNQAMLYVKIILNLKTNSYLA
jgi:hypothetical protein